MRCMNKLSLPFKTVYTHGNGFRAKIAEQSTPTRIQTARKNFRKTHLRCYSKGNQTSGEELLAAYREVQGYDDETLLHIAGRSSGGNYMKSHSREIFANTEVNMADIDVIGFDYDYTLVSYTTALQDFIYNRAREFMVSNMYYPDGILHNTKFDKNFAIRGLCYDKESGLLFKLDSSNRLAMDSVFFGRQRLTRKEAMKEFGSRHLSHDYVTTRLSKIPDQFTLAEACLLSDVCQYFIQSNMTFHPGAVTEDVNEAIRYVHKSGAMHQEVMDNMDKYYHPIPHLPDMLRQFKQTKKTFLMSNSSFEYVNTGLTYLVGADWMELFDVVMTSSRKPSFYTGKSLFRKLDVAHEEADNSDSKLIYRSKWSTVGKLKSGSAYIKGNIQDFLDLTGWNGKNILYIGDNLSADLVEPARRYGWYTGAIIRELENEIKRQGTKEYQALSVKLQLVEECMRRLQWCTWDCDIQHESGTESKLSLTLSELESERYELQRKMDSIMNKNFGSVFSGENGAPTFFASAVDECVDLYTARLENFNQYSNEYRFYPRKRGLPHEPPGRLGLVTDLLKFALRDKPIQSSDIGLTREKNPVLSEISFK